MLLNHTWKICHPNDPQENIQISWIFAGVLELPLFILEFVLTLFFLASLYRAMKYRRVSRKCYLLIANRAIGDLIVSGIALGNNIAVIKLLYPATYVYPAVYIDKNINYENTRNVIVILSIYSCSFTYIALSLLKLYTVTRPFQYLRSITMKRIIQIVILIWILTAVFIFVFELTTIFKIDDLLLFNRVFSGILFAVLVITMLCFAYTVLAVKRAQRFFVSSSEGGRDARSGSKTSDTGVSELGSEDYSIMKSPSAVTTDMNPSIKHYNSLVDTSSKPSERNTDNANRAVSNPSITSTVIVKQSQSSSRWRFSMWKLAFNVATFAFFNLNYLVSYVYVEYWVAVGLSCVGIKYANENSLLLVRGITFALLKFRIIVDPIVTFCIDKAIRRCMLELLMLPVQMIKALFAYRCGSSVVFQNRS